MNIRETGIDGLIVVEPKVWGDTRGSFLETFQLEKYRDIGIDQLFVQDNLSRSFHGVVRGLHFQRTKSQGKLVTCLTGRVLDVVVDLRAHSHTWGQTFSIVLDAETRNQLWIPPGFAHGFSVLSEIADFFYKCTDYYDPEDEAGISWNDPDLGVDWQVVHPIVSPKDQALPSLREILT